MHSYIPVSKTDIKWLFNQHINEANFLNTCWNLLFTIVNTSVISKSAYYTCQNNHGLNMTQSKMSNHNKTEKTLQISLIDIEEEIG